MILIVDDSLTVRMHLAEAIEAVGFSTIGCGSIAEARAALHGRPVSLAILDVRLPDGSGVDLLHEIRNDARLAELPVLMLSSEAEVADRIHGLQTGANDYLGKPFDTALVVGRVRDLAGLRATSQPLLVIDDSATFRKGLAEQLRAAGYAVATAATASDGLRLAASLRPRAIIVDGILPDLRGDLVIRRIRLDPALRTTPCLLLTGSDDTDAEIAALDAGADAFARKHSDIEVVLARLSAMLRGVHDLRSMDVSSALGPARVLAVDDSPTYLHSIAEALHQDGHDVVTAESGEQALELLAVQFVDCIVLDLVMPGLSGIETCRRIKAVPVIGDVPLIALSGEDRRDAIVATLAAGADDYISKTAGNEVLRARVSAQIRRKRVTDEQRAVRERILRSERDAAEARAAQQLAEAQAAMAERLEIANRELEAANRELESFSYSVSHDLRAPLRAIRSFTQMIEEDGGAALDDRTRSHLRRVIAATGRMFELIEALLDLARISRAELMRTGVDLSAIALASLAELRARDPARIVDVSIAPGLRTTADARLVRALIENLIGNAWKFTAARDRAHIEVGRHDDGGRPFYVRDDGIGFDAAFADRLFVPFQRLHGAEIPGTGIGLATVRRIVERHGGRIWAESTVGQGTAIYFTLPE